MKIEFAKGTGKSDKAKFVRGKQKIPLAVITRLMDKLGGKSGPALDRLFYQGLERYEDFLTAMEAASITPAMAVEQMEKLKPVKEVKSGTRKSKGVLLAASVSKLIARRYKGQPEEMVMDFLDAVSKPEFTVAVIAQLTSFKAEFGSNALGFIKASGRRGTAAAIAALKARRGQ